MAIVASLPACLRSPLVQSRVHRQQPRRVCLTARAESTNSATATAEPTPTPAAAAPEATAAAAGGPKKERKASPLERGGTLSGAAAAGKDASDKFKAAAEGKTGSGPVLQIVDGRFRDFRWVNGTWNMAAFKKSNGEVDWDAVIDAEMARRKLLEDTPIPSITEEAVVFDTADIPWWAWVRRFHLPEAEKLNGRAAMVGYFMALIVDKLTGGVPLADQQGSFLGKLLLFITVGGILLIRTSSDIEKYKTLLDEATFYDKQWDATWQGVERPSEAEIEGRA